MSTVHCVSICLCVCLFLSPYLCLFVPQTVQFCELFELEVEVEKKRVKFDRVKTDSIVLEERSVTVTKSPHLVLSKNSKSLGEVSWGECWNLSIHSSV